MGEGAGWTEQVLTVQLMVWVLVICPSEYSFKPASKWCVIKYILTYSLAYRKKLQIGMYKCVQHYLSAGPQEIAVRSQC